MPMKVSFNKQVQEYSGIRCQRLVRRQCRNPIRKSSAQNEIRNIVCTRDLPHPIKVLGQHQENWKEVAKRCHKRVAELRTTEVSSHNKVSECSRQKSRSDWRLVAKRCRARRQREAAKLVNVRRSQRRVHQPDRYLKPYTGKELDDVCELYDLDESPVKVSKSSCVRVEIPDLDDMIDPCRDWSSFHKKPC